MFGSTIARKIILVNQLVNGLGTWGNCGQQTRVQRVVGTIYGSKGA